MARRKNVKRIDPRYFMDEKMERLDEAAPGSQIFEPGATDKVQVGDTQSAVEPHPMMADVLQGMNDKDKAMAFLLEWIRLEITRGDGKRNSVARPGLYNFNQVGQYDYKDGLLKYMQNLGLQKGSESMQNVHTILLKITEDLKNRVWKNEKLTGGWGWTNAHSARLHKCERGKAHPSYQSWCKEVENLAIEVKDPISGDTFKFMPTSLEGGGNPHSSMAPVKVKIN